MGSNASKPPSNFNPFQKGKEPSEMKKESVDTKHDVDSEDNSHLNLSGASKQFKKSMTKKLKEMKFEGEEKAGFLRAKRFKREHVLDVLVFISMSYFDFFVKRETDNQAVQFCLNEDRLKIHLAPVASWIASKMSNELEDPHEVKRSECIEVFSQWILEYEQLGGGPITMPLDRSAEFVSHPIYERPKDEVPSTILSKSNSVKKESIDKNKGPTLSLFQNMEVTHSCNGVLECPSAQRMIAVLDYYNSMMNTSENGVMDNELRAEFIAFCDKYYGENMMLEDYTHCIERHCDKTSRDEMSAALNCKCSVGSKHCGGMRRHFRDRATDTERLHFFVEIMDTMHFNVLHLEDVGLRVNLNLESESKQKEDNLVDEAVLKMSRVIRSKREQHNVGRLDDTPNNGKFTLCANVANNEQSEGKLTVADQLHGNIWKKANTETKNLQSSRMKLQHFEDFREDQHYDTETLHDDMKVFGEEGNSNVAEALRNDEKFFGEIRRMLRYLRVSGSSFSTGKWFMYWDWYRTEEWTKKVMNHYLWGSIDFGGHSVESLCVDPHFKNLEEEVLSSGLITKENWLKILEKAARFMKTSRCKKMKSNEYGDRYHYEIAKGSVISLHHLCTLLLYTDSSAFCTAMSETSRAIFGGETIEEINKRNSRFYWSSRYLRELVLCFGSTSRYQRRPFWCGISFPLHIPQFQIGLIGPTSTSMAKEVALRFAGEQGMMLQLKGGGSKCFNAAPFSCYPEEEERIFCGSSWREEVVSIVMVETSKNYKSALSAFTKFDAIFSGLKVSGLKMSVLDLEIIKESLRWIEGGEDAVNHKKLDLFILETFYSFVLHKKMVSLNLFNMHRVKEKEIINLVMNPLWNSHPYCNNEGNEPKDANLMKPFVFTLFRHVHTIRVKADHHPFDLLSFLRMLQSEDLPETLRLIIVEDGYGSWLQMAFDKVKEVYNAANIEWEQEGNNYLYLKF